MRAVEMSTVQWRILSNYLISFNKIYFLIIYPSVADSLEFKFDQVTMHLWYFKVFRTFLLLWYHHLLLETCK
jgi:hypothetical protein